ncbi:MAG: glycosyltransferase family 2 protein [Thermoguttaceae bacterium]|nr:glycosyltransferase family 2 protein [Thermoguttaceae bacterium]
MLSIIIPVYNQKNLVALTLDSIAAQTRGDWECVLVDDHSDDGTDLILKEYAERDSRFRFFRRPDSCAKGASACRNYGLSQTRGEYIYFFDSDDLLAPEFAETFVPYLEKDPGLDFVHFRYIRFQGTVDRVVRVCCPKPPEMSFVEAMSGMSMAVGTQYFLWRRSLIDAAQKAWREDLHFGEDFEYYFRLIHYARRGLSVDDPILVYYRRNRRGICYRCRHEKTVLKSLLAMCQSLTETALSFGDDPAVQNGVGRTIRKQIRETLRFGDLEYLAEFLRLADRLDLAPGDRKWFDWVRRHPFIAILRYRPFFLFDGVLQKFLTKISKS